MNKRTLPNFGWIIAAVLLSAIALTVFRPLGAHIQNTNSDTNETTAVLYENPTDCSTSDIWSDKKWVVAGDSLSDPATVFTSKQYYNYISENTDVEIINVAKRATGYAKGTVGSELNPFYDRISNVPADADVITVFGSFNDLSSGLPYGSVDDTGTATVAGCINTTLDNLISAAPNAKIGIILPTPWAAYNDVQPLNESTLSAATTYINLLVDICEKRNIPYLDLYHNSDLIPWDADFRNEYYSNDLNTTVGIHPNEAGHQIIAPKIEKFVESLLIG